MKDFAIQYPNDDTPAAESGKADDLRTDDKDGHTFWGKVASEMTGLIGALLVHLVL